MKKRLLWILALISMPLLQTVISIIRLHRDVLDVFSRMLLAINTRLNEANQELSTFVNVYNLKD